MRFLPHTAEEISSMLQVVGVDSLADLFPTVPEDCRPEREADLPDPMSEWELNDHMRSIADAMTVKPDFKAFIGAGSYHHHIPAIIPSIIGRSEFLTAYTPYQPEMAQGTLQGIFEYQTLTARLLGMDVANASMYDGASALAEALLMALRTQKKKKKVAVSSRIHPHYLAVVNAYFEPTEFTVEVLPGLEDGRTDLSSIAGRDDLAGVAIQSPNFFGVVEDLTAAGETIHKMGALLVACFTEALAWGLLKNPGSCGADIVCGEGQSMGIPRSYGGPGLGMFACNKKFMRNMPGRLIGQTTDLDGKRGFVLTLATREQHIRREKATSNICSNQGICSMTAGMYMATVGGTGIRKLAQVNHDKAEYLKKKLAGAGAKITFSSPTFNEFVASFPEGGFEAARERLLAKKIVAGLPLSKYFPELEGHYLFCVTETLSREDMDLLVQEVKS